jgi:uncharacterized protein with PQ loop repeat
MKLTKKAYGYTGTLLIQVSYIPQMYKILSTQSVNDISKLLYIILSLGIALLLYYSIRIKDRVHIIGNVWALSNSIITLMMIMYYSF